MHMHAAEFCAAVEGRKHFSRIKELLCVKGAFDRNLVVKIDFRKHLGHEIAFFDADAMLAGEHAAVRNAKPQDVGAKFFRALELARLIRIIKNQRMQIAVARMEDVGDAEPMADRQFADSRKHGWKLPARDRAVHAKIIGREVADRWESRLPPGPKGKPLGVGGGNPAFVSAM